MIHFCFRLADVMSEKKSGGEGVTVAQAKLECPTAKKLLRPSTLSVDKHWPVSKERLVEMRKCARVGGRFSDDAFKSLKKEYARKHSAVPWSCFKKWCITGEELKGMLVDSASDLTRVGWASVYRPDIPITRYLRFPCYICRICKRSFHLHSHILGHELSHGLSMSEIGVFVSSLPDDLRPRMVKSFESWKNNESNRHSGGKDKKVVRGKK
jgi:hypothetical protein